jgi:cytochrome c-type biogenesis protein
MSWYEHVTAFSAGLVSFFSPCILPLAPPYLAFLAGVQLGATEDEKNLQVVPNTHKQGPAGDAAVSSQKLQSLVMYTAVFFLLGLATVLVLLGMSASIVGKILVQYRDVMILISGIVLCIFGIHFLGFVFKPLQKQFRIRLDTFARSHKGSYIAGMAFAFGWTPCVGPILGSILLLAANKDSTFYGAWLLFLYSMGMGVPFLITAYFLEELLEKVGAMGRHAHTIQKFMGVVLIVVGVFFITGYSRQLFVWLYRIIPNSSF